MVLTRTIEKILLGILIGIILFLLSGLLRDVSAEKYIHVDLTHQHLYAYENGALVYDFPVSTGKTATPTPVGAFWPWIKLRYDDMAGGNRTLGNYYYLPDVPYVVYFYNAAYPQYDYYALHGTYWHNNFGHPMSHGCVNLRTADMAKLYYWLNTVSYDRYGRGSGTIIYIFGTTPAS